MSEHGLYNCCPLIRTPRLPAVDWTDIPADLNGLVRFAERPNLVSARVPSRFERAITIYQLAQYHIPGDIKLHQHYSRNLESHKLIVDEPIGNFVICTLCQSTRSLFVTLLSRHTQSGRWSSLGKRVWFTESRVVLIISLLVWFTQFIVDKIKKMRAVSS